MTLLILLQLSFIATLLLRAGKDALSIKLRNNQVNGLTLTRLRRWHRDGAADYFLYCIVVSFLANWWLLVPALLLRVALFDPAVNFWQENSIGNIGTTAFWDKQFAKVFGKKGAVKKAIVFFILVIALNLVYFKVHGQTFIGAGATTSGMNLTAGYSAKSVVYTFDYKIPLIKASIPNTVAILAGLKVTDGLTISAGVGRYRLVDLSKYNEYFNYQIAQVTEYHPAIKIDTYRRFHDGHVFMSLNWCGMGWAAVGIRAYID